jgi:hypothetical protein
MTTVCIYGLSDPFVSSKVRYVGKAADVVSRYCNHLLRGRHRQSRCARWVVELLEQGRLPAVEVLAVVPSDTWQVHERWWIAYLSLDHDLLNETAGGKGLSNPSTAVRERLSEAARTAAQRDPHWGGRGLKRSDAVRARVREGARNRRRPELPPRILCPICGGTYAAGAGLARHRAAKHTD